MPFSLPLEFVLQEFELKELTEKVISAAYEVHNSLGSGFLEKVYENALLVELKGRGVIVEPQKAMQVRYKGVVVGEYVADMVVQGCLIIELKAVDKIIDAHELQLKNYLKATGVEVGLLLNFGRSVEVKRKYVQVGHI